MTVCPAARAAHLQGRDLQWDSFIRRLHGGHCGRCGGRAAGAHAALPNAQAFRCGCHLRGGRACHHWTYQPQRCFDRCYTGLQSVFVGRCSRAGCAGCNQPAANADFLAGLSLQRRYIKPDMAAIDAAAPPFQSRTGAAGYGGSTRHYCQRLKSHHLQLHTHST